MVAKAIVVRKTVDLHGSKGSNPLLSARITPSLKRVVEIYVNIGGYV